MEASGLSPWNNNWSEIYDFTPSKPLNYELVNDEGELFMPTFDEVEDDIM
jgi:hypothetical protein